LRQLQIFQSYLRNTRAVTSTLNYRSGISTKAPLEVSKRSFYGNIFGRALPLK